MKRTNFIMDRVGSLDSRVDEQRVRQSIFARFYVAQRMYDPDYKYGLL